MKLSFTFLSKKNKGEHLFSQNKYEKTNKIEKDWARLIFLFFVVLLVVSFLGYREYSVLTLNMNKTDEGEWQGIINDGMLTKTITVINEREKLFELYQSTTTSLIDPSL